MAQHAIEMILSKHLAEHLSIPAFLVNPAGDIVFYNEAAEPLFGRRFEEGGPMTAAEWATLLVARDEQGVIIPHDQLPVVVAFTRGVPASATIWIGGREGVPRALQVTAIPLVRHAGECVGAMATFWEVPAA